MNFDREKHGALIKAWVDGAEIEYRPLPDTAWYRIATPLFYTEAHYRIKISNAPLLIPNNKYDFVYVVDVFDMIRKREPNHIGKDAYKRGCVYATREAAEFKQDAVRELLLKELDGWT